MSKKKNVRSKKAKTLLRGAIAAGAAIGGADVLGDSNVVYAAEGEFEQFNEGAGEIVVPSYSEQTLSEGAAEALSQEQPVAVESVEAVSVEVTEQQPAEPSVNTVEVLVNEQADGITEAGVVPAEPAEDLNAVNPGNPEEGAQIPENEDQEDVTNPAQESSEAGTESTETAESEEDTASENSESEAVSSESTYEDESDSVDDEESLSEEDSELKSLIEASESASTSLVSMNDSLSAESVSLSTSLSVGESQDSSTVVSQSMSAVLASQQESASLSTSLSIASSEREFASTSASEVKSEYDSALEDFKKNEYYDEEFEQLIEEIKAAQKDLQDYVAKHNKMDAGYYERSDKLAWALTKYAFKVQTFGQEVTLENADDTPEQKKGYNPLGNTDRDNYYEISYKDADGRTHKAYYDYWYVKEDGTRWDGKKDTLDRISGIAILDKGQPQGTRFGKLFWSSKSKGDPIFVEKTFNEGSDQYNSLRSELTDAEKSWSEASNKFSEFVSGIDSVSKSLSESIST
ncbi:MAG: hypothetical protein HFG94_03465, partial [Dorea sp.]|nr:hypothetical protein [Dorea sp.]